MSFEITLWSLLIAVGTAVWYFFYPANNVFLELRCTPGINLNDDFMCNDGKFERGALLQTYPEKQSQKALIRILKRDDSWTVDELYLRNCDVISDYQWKCYSSAADAMRMYGESNGTFFSALVGDALPQIYRTSISGYRLFLLNLGVSLPSVVNVSWPGQKLPAKASQP